MSSRRAPLKSVGGKEKTTLFFLERKVKKLKRETY
jgi:hypothetical protein